MRVTATATKTSPRFSKPLARRLAGALGLALAATLLQGTPAAAKPRWTHPVAGDITHVKGVVPAAWKQYPVWTADAHVMRGDRQATWPAAQSLTVDVANAVVSELAATSRSAKGAGVKAGTSPVWVTPVAADGFDVLPNRSAATSLSKLAVQVHDRSAAQQVGVQGLVLQVGRADGVRSSGRAAVSVDYSSFAQAGGGDWSSRLRLVQLPACALTTPQAAGCSTATPLESRNDTKSQTVTAVAPVAADGGGTVMMLSSAPSGDNGDYTATSLSPASTWDVSPQTGAFSWSYPLRMVPGVGGPTPTLSMAYSSQTMDGRTGGNNTQGSWIGDGFDMWPGFVERSYKSCAEDTGPQGGQDPNNKTNKTGDQCWWKQNATMSLNGRSTELVDAGGGLWKGVSDDGSKVELLTGGGNGDNDGEYWKVTTIDGTRYFFGRQYGAGGASAATATDSTWTTEVFGNHPGDPGYVAGNFAGSRQTQAWRWNLSYVVDPHGNTMTMFYGKETGAYGRELDVNKRTTYDRGGYLTRIEYGNRADASASTYATAQVVFDIADRCTPGATCFDGQGKAIEASFPDTPFDQYCYATPCTDKLSPTFWTQKRLAKIRTQVHTTGGAYSDVESWTLRHEYLDAGVATGEGIPMFLRGITRTGHVTTAGGVEKSDPEVVFDPGADPLPNRVDNPNDNRTALNRWRIKTITTETGAQILVGYKPAECTSGALPTPHSNDKLCFPQYYAPEGMTPTLDWFHKYVVAKVTANDNAAGSESQETYYDYLDTPAWHYDDSELVKEDKRTWGQYRGFGHVRVRKGFTTGVQLTNESWFLRGMDGDKQPSGTPRDVWVSDAWGNSIEDHQAYSGTALEQRTVNGANGLWVSGTVNTPTTPINTATSGALKAWMVNTGTVRNYSRTTQEADGV
ncbi:MAG TPA: hypothetical protein DGG94_13900, partial [Micromonosporaceae bacterium]|nr:hypothetical protein [Micromonosporaceae bacterium]